MSNEKAKKYLSENPEVKEVFATSDGFLFLKKYDAQEHANSLDADSPVVETYTQSDEPANEVKQKALTAAEVKAKAAADYTELFGSAPAANLSGPKIQALIDAKIAESKKASEETGESTGNEGE